MNTARQDERGQAMVGYLLLVIMVVVTIATYAKPFGHMLARRWSAGTASLDAGKGLERVPVKIEAWKEGWGISEDTGNDNWGDWFGNRKRSYDPDRDADGPRYSDGGRRTNPEDLYSEPRLGEVVGWSGEELLQYFTQFDASESSRVYCAATSTVALAVLGGPDALEALVRRLRSQIIGGRTPKEPGEDRMEAIEAENRLASLLEKIDRRDVRPEDLGDLVTVMANLYNAQKNLGAGQEASREMMNLVRRTEREIAAPPRNAQAMKRFVEDELRPGEAIRSSVDLSRDNRNDHAILIGKDARGRTFVYDPWPKTAGVEEDGVNRLRGQLVYQDRNPQQFNYYLEKMIAYPGLWIDGQSAGHISGGKVYGF